MRTLIYARYSSQLQNARSIEDQIALCRERCAREGWTVVDVYTDYAISGAAGIDGSARPGLNACLARIEAGGIDQLLAESTDRLARHQGDAFAIRERVTFAGARIFTLFDGEVDDITGTIKGLFDARFRKDLGARIRRGQRGAVSEGRAPAGRSYGYRRANRLDGRGELVRGLREVDPDQAAVVRRIFELYAAGRSAQDIARRLNREGVPGPRGSAWTPTTICGDRKRLNGMLRNRLYVGELVHNRTSKVLDPRTRRERIRPNPPDQWIRKSVPSLRIVDDELWERVQEQLARRDGGRPHMHRRPKRLLSGLVQCGCCGGRYIVRGVETWGCAAAKVKGTCGNTRTIRTHLLEARVLRGLQEGMLDPAVVAAYVREYHASYGRTAAELRRGRARVEKAIAEADARIARLVDAIAAGADFGEVREALARERERRAVAEAELREIEDMPIVAIHPRLADEYRARVADLGRALAGHDDAGRDEVAAILRGLIDRIVVTPAATPRGVEITVDGRLASILALASGQPSGDEHVSTMERVKGIARKHMLLRAVV